MLLADVVLYVRYRKSFEKILSVAFWIYILLPIAAATAQLFYSDAQFIIWATVIATLVMFTAMMKQMTEEYKRQKTESARLETEMSMAAKIQEAMLPNAFPAFPDRKEFDIFASMNPAKEVGGDFYNFFMIDGDTLGIIIADVSDKGVPAALFMMSSDILLKNHMLMKKSPKAVLEEVNRLICESNREEMFVTVWLGILDIKTGRLTAANAGHEKPAIKSADGSFVNNIAGVVSVTDCFEENGTAYYVMEYLDGVPLRQLVPEHGMELRAASGIILQAGRTLNLVHREKGYLHRDVSPENIMVLLSGRVVIIDFGSARNFFMSNSNYTITLKHGFAPIEQYSSADIQGPFTDVYGLASTYYYVLTGKVLPRATDRLTGVAYEPLSVLRPDVGEEISEIVDKALMLQPSERTQTVGEFVSALESVVSRRSCEEGFVYVSVSIDGAVQERYKIEEDKEILVGRSPKCDVVFPGCENVSKVHCKLMFDREKKQFCLEDCSTNGTYINYVKMDKDTKYYVGSQDLIILANTRYRLILGE